jgi:hypothetical protein
MDVPRLETIKIIDTSELNSGSRMKLRTIVPSLGWSQLR